MTMSIEIWLSGFFFLFIIVTNILSNVFGYKTFGNIDTDIQLQAINKDTTKFKISFVLIVTEHFGIIFLAVILFISFGRYNIVLGIIWCVSRIGEGSIQIYDKKNYWGLLNIASEYSGSGDAEKDKLNKSARIILKSKDNVFQYSQILFSIGTFSYSLVFIIYGIVPIFIGWLGFIASIIYGLGNVIYLRKQDIKAIWSLGGLIILLFELILGIWLLFFT